MTFMIYLIGSISLISTMAIGICVIGIACVIAWIGGEDEAKNVEPATRSDWVALCIGLWCLAWLLFWVLVPNGQTLAAMYLIPHILNDPNAQQLSTLAIQKLTSILTVTSGGQ